MIIFGFAGGYALGKYESEWPDDSSIKVIEFESETQIFHSLTKKEVPVFLYFFSPGYKHSMDLHEGAEKAAAQHGDKLDFIRVNCKTNIDYC